MLALSSSCLVSERATSLDEKSNSYFPTLRDYSASLLSFGSDKVGIINNAQFSKSSSDQAAVGTSPVQPGNTSANGGVPVPLLMVIAARSPLQRIPASDQHAELRDPSLH